MEAQQQNNDCTISKILVAIDGSEHSMKAAELALEMAKIESTRSPEGSSELTALTVLDVSKPRKLLSSFIAAPTYCLRELEEIRNAANRWMDGFERKQKMGRFHSDQK